MVEYAHCHSKSQTQNGRCISQGAMEVLEEELAQAAVEEGRFVVVVK